MAGEHSCWKAHKPLTKIGNGTGRAANLWEPFRTWAAVLAERMSCLIAWIIAGRGGCESLRKYAASLGECHWSMRSLFIDAMIVIFLGLALLHFNVWTLALLLLAGGVLIWIDRHGINPGNSFRHIQTFMIGPVITARGRLAQRMPVDYGFESNGVISNRNWGRLAFRWIV